MKDFIVRQGDEMLNFLIKKFDMINVYLKELDEYGSTSNTDMGNMDDVDSIVQSLYDEDILYRKHYDYDTLYDLVWKAMDKAAKIANQKYNSNKQQNKIKITESQLRNIISESVKRVLREFDPDDYDEGPWDFRDIPDCESTAAFYYDPYSENLDILSGEQDGAAYIEFNSNDFPDAYSYDNGYGDGWNSPREYDEDCGECGGKFEYLDGWVPEDLEDRQEEIEARFVELHRQDIIDELTKNATFA